MKEIGLGTYKFDRMDTKLVTYPLELDVTAKNSTFFLEMGTNKNSKIHLLVVQSTKQKVKKLAFRNRHRN